MRIADILHRKGHVVQKTGTSQTALLAAQALTAHNIGALLVYDQWGHYVGIFSERDLIRGLAEFGADAIQLPVSRLMTPDVITCAPEDLVKNALRLMTVHRIRHLPVSVRGEIVGIVSIGDLVHRLMDEKKLEVDVLHDLARAHLAS